MLGLDPSLTNWGYALGEYDESTNTVGIDSVGVITPIKETSKQVRQNSKDISRASELSLKVGQLLASHQPHAVFVEVPVGSQSARAMASYGICIGILSAFISTTKHSFFEITPTEVKLSAVGSKTATKQEMIDWATGLYPNANWPTFTQKGVKTVTAGKAEHMADAVGAIHAGIYRSAEFQKHLHVISKMMEIKNASKS